MGLICTAIFVLANYERLLEEGDTMNNVIEVTPNKDGKLFITLYGTTYEIVVKKPTATKKAVDSKDEN